MQSRRPRRGSELGIGAAIWERHPSIELNGSLNLESLTLSDLLTKGCRAFSIGPELSVPVFDGGANKARIETAEAQHRDAIALYRGTVITAVKEVEDALTNQRSYRELAVKNRPGAVAASKTTSLLELYTKGLVNFIEVVDSQREELQAQRSVTLAAGSRLVAAVHLMKALGGRERLSGI